MVASDVNLSSQPTTQQVLFTAFLHFLGWVPPLSSLLGYVNPQKSYGLGLLTLIKLLLQSTRMMSLSKLSKMGTPWRLISLAPLSSLQAWPAMAEASGKTSRGRGGKGEGKTECYTICTNSTPWNPAHRFLERDWSDKEEAALTCIQEVPWWWLTTCYAEA